MNGSRDVWAQGLLPLVIGEFDLRKQNPTCTHTVLAW